MIKHISHKRYIKALDRMIERLLKVKPKNRRLVWKKKSIVTVM